MHLDTLKKGLFGYRKASVFRYIAAVEEDCSARLAQEQAKAAQTAEAYKQRVQELEASLQTLQQAYDTQKNNQIMIADALLDAQNYAAGLRAKSEEREQELRQTLEEEANRQQQQLEAYREQILELRQSFHTILQEMDQEAHGLEHRVETLKAAAPAGHMSLFRRKSEPVE